MPRDAKKGRRRHNLLNTSAADITLNDFADCARPQACNRIKRSVVRARTTEEIPMAAGAADQRLIPPEFGDDDTEWFEKDLKDFVIEDNREIDEEEEEEEEDINISKAHRLSAKARQRLKEENIGRRMYPPDVWFLISKFVSPEDIGRFAGICKGSWAVTHTAGFWRELFHRYYNPSHPNMSVDIRPTCIEKLHGLRWHVIRALHYFDTRLASEVNKKKGPMEDDPHTLTGQRCLLAWHAPSASKKGWDFCFKFQKPSLQALSSRPSRQEDVYKGYNDLYYNTEEGCSVLIVTCSHLGSLSVSAIMGLLLNQVYLTLSPGLYHHRLRLHFDSRPSQSQYTPSNTVVTLDAVNAIKIMQWWYPNYPFTR